MSDPEGSFDGHMHYMRLAAERAKEIERLTAELEQVKKALETIYDCDYQAPHDATDAEVSESKKRCIFRMRKLAKDAINSAPPAIPADPDMVQVPRDYPFAKKIISKLKRFNECAEDPGADGVDIGRHWLDLLTQLGLLNRVQRSPALWQISQQGEDVILSSKGDV